MIARRAVEMGQDSSKPVQNGSGRTSGKAFLSMLFLVQEIRALRNYIRHHAKTTPEDIQQIENTIMECRGRIAQQNRKIRGMES